MRLPRGLSIQNGYLRLRVYHRGIEIENKSLGLATPEAIRDASLYLAKTRDKLRAARLGLPVHERELLFKDAAEIYCDLWPKERDANGQLKHTGLSITNTLAVVNRQLVPYFGKKWLDAIKTGHVVEWREALLRRGVTGATANRYQAVLGSVMSHIKRWSELEKIEPVRCPSASVTANVERSEVVKRTRILSQYEFQKLKLAFRNVGDFAGEQVVIYAVITQMNEKDMRRIRVGEQITMKRSKTGEPITLPIRLMTPFDWGNWQERWTAARKAAGLLDVQFRDLRKTGINVLTGKFDDVLVSQYAAHKDTETTRDNYIVDEAAKLKPLADELIKWTAE